MRQKSRVRSLVSLFLRVAVVILVLESVSGLILFATDLVQGQPFKTALRNRAVELFFAWRPAERFGEFDPLVQIRHEPGGLYYGLRVNEHGFIGNGNPDTAPDDYPQKPSGVFRIVALGGSTMAGLGVEKNSQTIPALLERILNEEAPPGLRFQVLNLGAAGGYTASELQDFAFKVPYLNADLVLALDGYNDANNAFLEADREGLEHSVINWGDFSYHFFNYMNGVGPWGRPPLKVFTFSSRLVFRVREMVREKDLQRLYNAYPYYRLSGEVKKEDPGLMNVTRNNLEFMAALACRNRLGLLCFLQPHALNRQKNLTKEELDIIEKWFDRYTAHGESFRPERYVPLMNRAFEDLEAVYTELSWEFRDCPRVRFISITGAFREETGNLYLDTVHTNEKGNRILARAMADEILALVRQKSSPASDAAPSAALP